MKDLAGNWMRESITTREALDDLYCRASGDARWSRVPQEYIDERYEVVFKALFGVDVAPRERPNFVKEGG